MFTWRRLLLADDVKYSANNSLISFSGSSYPTTKVSLWGMSEKNKGNIMDDKVVAKSLC